MQSLNDENKKELEYLLGLKVDGVDHGTVKVGAAFSVASLIVSLVATIGLSTLVEKCS